MDTNSGLDLSDVIMEIAHAFEGRQDKRATLYSTLIPFFTRGDNIIDLGMGDGTWLQLLADHGINAIGVDMDSRRVDAVTKKGLKAVQSDVRCFLETVQDRIDGLTMLHIIEHLHPTEAIDILYRCVRQMGSRGRVVIVTPNFEHPSVYSKWFWLDITHVRPYPVELLCRILNTLQFQTIMSGTMNNDLDVFVYGSLQADDIPFKPRK